MGDSFLENIPKIEKEYVKVFFICPNLQQITRELLELCFLNGVEAYIVYGMLDIREKIEVLIQEFKEIIILFNISKPMKFSWDKYIKDLIERNKNNEKVKIGVVHEEVNETKVKNLSQYYIGTAGVQAGCIQLLSNGIRNRELLSILFQALEANRRKRIRLPCTYGSNFNFTYQEKIYKGTIRDISVSHFTGVFDKEIPNLKPTQKLVVNLHISGYSREKQKVMFALNKQDENSKMIYLFTFSEEIDIKNKLIKIYLPEEEKKKLNNAIFSKLQERVNGYLIKKFQLYDINNNE